MIDSILLITIAILIALFDFVSTEHNLTRGAWEANLDFKSAHWLTWKMILNRLLYVIPVFVLFHFYGNPILIFFNIGYGYKMIKNNLRTMIRLWGKPVIYKRRIK